MDGMPEDLPDRIPEDMPGRMPEDMPDRMPEDLPVTRCINVMVGITRSKVISFFFANRRGADLRTGDPNIRASVESGRVQRTTFTV